ncbi:hypothetical protein OBBRIDRAFT_740072, partial [Obba rivulosa]
AALVKKNSEQGVLLSKPTIDTKCKVFNLNTPKLHFLGHYTAIIRKYGTTNLYTMQHISE